MNEIYDIKEIVLSMNMFESQLSIHTASLNSCRIIAKFLRFSVACNLILHTSIFRHFMFASDDKPLIRLNYLTLNSHEVTIVLLVQIVPKLHSLWFRVCLEL